MAEERESGQNEKIAEPESRVERILAKTLKLYTGELEEPESRIEKLLVRLCNFLENSHADWEETDESAAGYILNKPGIRKGEGSNSVVEGRWTKATGVDSHVEGNHSTATENYSHAEGKRATAKGEASHAEGIRTDAEGRASHAEGSVSVAIGLSAHAEGDSTTAKGNYSHAEGACTWANGDYSSTHGFFVTAEGRCQFAFGRFNIPDPSESYVEIVGNGNDRFVKSNARTLDWDGNETLAGKLTVGKAPETDMDVTTKKYVDDLAAELKEKIEALMPKKESAAGEDAASGETKTEPATDEGAVSGKTENDGSGSDEQVKAGDNNGESPV